MDNIHQEFFQILASLQAASAEQFRALFPTLVLHTQQHFEQEHQWMLACKFPAIVDHISEHNRVLGELRQLQTRVEKGSLSLARGFIQQLPAMFNLHVTTMDAALAKHFQYY